MNVLTLRTIHCPSCHLPVARHPRFVEQRVLELSCRSCAARLEVVLGAWSYPLLKTVSLVAWQIVGAGIVVAALLQRWVWMIALFGGVLIFEIARAFVARRGAEVRWINQGSMQRQAAGRWVPE